MMALQTPSRPRPRPETKRPRAIPVDEQELANPSLHTVWKLIWNAFTRLFHDPVAMIIGSGFVLLMAWGVHGNLDLLGLVWDGWKGPGSDPATRAQILPGVEWDQEWLSFWAGAVIVVAIPVVLIKRVYRQPLAHYGLGLPKPGRRKLAVLASLALFVPSLVLFYFGAQNPGMAATYPFFRDFDGIGELVVYELGYLPFFLAIEFIFRGYLLLGLYQFRDDQAPPGVSGEQGPLVFGYYAILISMLSYTAWHLGKPVPELWGTLAWGLAAGAIVLAIRSIWPVVVVHWLLNVWLDLLIYEGW
jgi:hypothetical protein